MRILIGLILMSAGSPMMAEETRAISVLGVADIQVVPDRASVMFGVQIIDLDPQKAMMDLATRSQKIVEAVKAAGVDPKDIQTSQLSLQPYWNGEKNEGFTASNSLSVMVTDLASLPKLLGALVAAGMNDLSGLTFVSSLQKEKEAEAMLLAVADAHARAEALATAAGMKLGDPISIDYHSGGGMPQPVMMAKAANAPMDEMAIEAGQLSIASTVSIRYELLPN